MYVKFDEKGNLKIKRANVIANKDILCCNRAGFIAVDFCSCSFMIARLLNCAVPNAGFKAHM
jgi:hypothetical protein